MDLETKKIFLFGIKSRNKIDHADDSIITNEKTAIPIDEEYNGFVTKNHVFILKTYLKHA